MGDIKIVGGLFQFKYLSLTPFYMAQWILGEHDLYFDLCTRMSRTSLNSKDNTIIMSFNCQLVLTEDNCIFSLIMAFIRGL